MIESGSALDSWVEAWRARHPQLEPAWTFLHGNERARYGAFEALKQEWLDAVDAIREPQVAATKLQWWRDELQLAQQGQARHPLTRALFAEAVARSLPAAWWNDAIDAALSSIDNTPAASFAEQCKQAQRLYGALARIETALWFGMDGDASRACHVAILEHLIDRLRHWPREIEHGRSPLPMALLARHGLTQTSLGDDSPARRDAIRDQIATIKQALDEADKMSGSLSLFCGLQMHLDRRALRHAVGADDSLSALQVQRVGVRALLDAWRAARAWRNAQS